jgi:hypothetical protein
LNTYLKYLFYSNAFIALSGGIYAFHDAIYHETSYSWDGIVFLIAITWLSYQLPLINCFLIAKHKPSKAKDQWFIQHQKLMLTITFVGIIYAAFYFFKLQQQQQCLVVILSLVSLAYVLPLQFQQYSLRNIPYLKALLIACSWSALSVFWWQSIAHESWQTFLIRSLVILVIILPFDIKDQAEDDAHQLKTLPMLIDAKQHKKLLFCLLGFALAGCIILNTSIDEYLFIGITAFALLFHNRKRNEYYYYFVLDGIFVLHGISVFLSWQICQP